jgi:hypothetical protein
MMRILVHQVILKQTPTPTCLKGNKKNLGQALAWDTPICKVNN